MLWVINLGCVDLNQWYATCDDVDRPDYVHFDLDPGAGTMFDRVLETALVVREALDVLKMRSVVKTTGEYLEQALDDSPGRTRPIRSRYRPTSAGPLPGANMHSGWMSASSTSTFPRNSSRRSRRPSEVRRGCCISTAPAG